MMSRLPSILALVLLYAALSCSAAAEVTLARVPENGLQPQVVVQGGVIHLIYLTGDPGAATIKYARSSDGGATWSNPLAVNAADAPAIAVGTVRGPHLAVGPTTGTVHVGWMASPKAMMYARRPAGGDAFTVPRNIVTARVGLDGGGSLAAGPDGRVHVAWHAPAGKPTDPDEGARSVFLTTSDDDGVSFSAERAICDRPTGVCACCGMRLFADGGRVYCIYRGAGNKIERGTFLLASRDGGQTFAVDELAPMTLAVCLLSTASLADAGDGTLVAWETLGNVSWGRIARDGTSVEKVIGATGERSAQKHPALAVAPSGDVLLAWTEGTSFGKGGAVAWQVYDANGDAKPGLSGRADGVPAHSLPAAFCDDQGAFVILY